MEVTDHQPIATAKKLFEYFDLTNKRWEGNRLSDWIFRGNADAKFKLLPKAWRPDEISKPEWKQARVLAEGYADKWMTRCNKSGPYQALLGQAAGDRTEDKVAALRSLVLKFRWESLLLQRFAELADMHGIPAGKESAEAKPIYPFDRNGRAPDPQLRDTYAQHHGVPTRLLDWTYNPLVAFFFATEDIALGQCKPESEKFTIWALNARVLNVLSRPMQAPRAKRRDGLYPADFASLRAGHAYLVAQAGRFTWVHGWERHFLEKGEFPTLDEAFEAAAKDEQVSLEKEGLTAPFFRRVDVPMNQAKEVMTILQRYRITRVGVMPTLDNVAKTLKAESLIDQTYSDFPGNEPDCHSGK